MDADEFFGPHAHFGQAGDRQGGGVAAEYSVFAELRFGALGDIGFQGAILEYRFDHQVAAFDGVVIGGGVDQGQQRVGLFLRHAAALDGFFAELFRIILAAIGTFLRGVDQHGFDTGAGLHVSDAGAHHAGAENGNLFRHEFIEAGRPAGALAQLVHRQKQRADHAARLRGGSGFGEVAGFDAQGCVDRHLQAFINAFHDVDLRRVIAKTLLAQHGVANDEHLRRGGVVRAAAGDFEVLLIPRRHRIRLGRKPGARRGDQLIGRHHFVNDALRQRVLWRERLAFQQQRQRLHGADQAWQTLRAAGAGQ